MTHGSLFSGGGGFDLAAEWLGWKNAFHCEWADFPQQILKYHFPNSVSYGDIKTTDFTIWRGRIDVLSGGFPCQPYSMAGKRLGKEDDRHLWPEMLRAIREIEPTWVVGENVRGLISWSGGLVFEEVQADLEAASYEVLPFILPAAGVGAPHRRDRVWFVAYRNDNGFDGPKNRQSLGKGNDNNKARQNQAEQFAGCANSDAWPPLDPHDQRNAARPRPIQKADGEIPKREDYAQPCNAGDGAAPDTCGSRLETDNAMRKPTGKVNASGYNCQDAPPDTTSEQSQRMRPEQREDSGAQQGKSGGGSRGVGSQSDAPHACNKRLQGSENNRSTGGVGEKRNEQPARCVPPTWHNFPTQPPVCRRDDGLSPQLDGITFSKWRNESIKLYGNAVVPPLVLQIFQAIQDFENL